jgi:hypothetical protein
MFIESISELTEMVVPLVVDVENKNVTVPEWKDHPVGPEQMKVLLHVSKHALCLCLSSKTTRRKPPTCRKSLTNFIT